MSTTNTTARPLVICSERSGEIVRRATDADLAACPAGMFLARVEIDEDGNRCAVAVEA